VRNSQPKSSLCRRIQHLDEWSTTSSSACPFFVCRQTLLLVSPHYHDNNTLLLPKKKQHRQQKKKKKKKSFFFFLLSREKRERNSRIRAGWMDEKEWRGGIKQKRVAAENRIDRVNPLFACFLSLSIIFSPVSLYFILFYFILSADGKE
jgi:predicted nucleotide-binding protein (sugar kinase/HSP70/actin superfamily)